MTDTRTVTDDEIKEWLAAKPETRGAWGDVDPDIPGLRKLIADSMLTEQLCEAATVPPCPSWCKHDEGHKYDSCDPDAETVERAHVSVADGVDSEAVVVLWEHNRHDVVTFALPFIRTTSSEGEELTADRARAVASELVAAAYLLDEIQAAQR